ncbi:MAG: MFS transporter, partial [Spirochaetota bacterium]
LAVGIGTEYVGLTSAVAGNAVVLIAVFNTLGRLGSGAAADKVGLRTVITALFVITIASVGILLSAKGSRNPLLFFTALSGIAVSFGGLLAVVPTLVGSFYGAGNLGSNYGFIFIAYGLAALVGPILKSALIYRQMFYISIAAAIIGILLSIAMRKPQKERLP